MPKKPTKAKTYNVALLGSEKDIREDAKKLRGQRDAAYPDTHHL